LSSTLTSPFSSLVPAASARPADDPIFALNAQAQERASKGEDILNATLGALMDDDGGLSVMPAVFEAFSGVDPARAAAYAPIAGDKEFLEAVVHDIFGDGPLAGRAVAAATAGGTGAIHHAIVNFLERGQALLTTSWYWSPYSIIAEHTGRAVTTFRMFASDLADHVRPLRFDLAALEQGLEQLIAKQGRALVVLNFPCHNPTGYSLDEDEWRGIARILEEAGRHAPVTLLLDLAYASYGAPGSERWVEWIEPATQSCSLLVAWTASKSFAQYGSRVGALVAVPADDKQAPAVKAALSYSCRGTWSNCNHLGLLAITSLLSDADLRRRADQDRAELVALLGRRVEAFNRHAHRADLSYPRYEGGFFVSVFTPDAERTAARCRDLGVFVVPLDGAVRIALCSTPMSAIPRLVEALAEGVQAAGVAS